MAEWPEGQKRYTVDLIVEKFWEFRCRGRRYQSLEEDVAFFLPGWRYSAGKEKVVEAWKQIMARKDWDVEQGGMAHTSQALVDQIRGRTPPLDKKGGLRVYA